MRRPLATAALTLLLAACASTPMVQTDHDPAVQFAQYHTYSWREKPQDGPALLMQRIVDDIDAQLAAKGWQQVPEGGDVAIAAHVATHERHRVDTFYDAPMWGGWGWHGPWGWDTGFAHSSTTTYTVGTLVVDMFDAKTRRAIWSGVAEGTVPSSPQQVNQKLDQAVAKMFAGFPPGTAMR
ncbi:MAG TPA: DUF4136 domain-containing protein [Xanthomonadaceae bacterium]|nr:DUF4136 domain-containing protein [Xanthomonadaceae bacterium]